MSKYGICKQFVDLHFTEFKHPAICPDCKPSPEWGYHRITYISDYVTHRVDYHNTPSWRVYDDLVCELKSQGLWDDCRECYDPCGGRYYTPHPCCGCNPHKCDCKEGLSKVMYHVPYISRSGYCNVCCKNPCRCCSWLPLLTGENTVWPDDCIGITAGEKLERGDRVKKVGSKVYKDNSVIICHSFFCGYCKRHSHRFKTITLSWPNGTNGFNCNYCGNWNRLSDNERDEIANSMRTSK